jgi:hypothetical protein
MSSTSKAQFKRPGPERGLPEAVDIERLVLGAIQLNGTRFPSVAQQLHPDDFGLEYHREIFKNMLALHTRGEAIDRNTLANQIQKRDPNFGTVNGLGYLADLDTGLPEILNLEGYVAIVKRASVLRKFIRETNSLTQRAMQHEDPSLLLPAGAEVIRKLQAETGQKAEAAPTVPQWPDPIHEDGFHGVAGDLVRLIEPHSESDPAGLLVQLLVSWGSLAGRSGYYPVEDDRHHTNLFCVLVGVTSKGRKGTSWGRIRGVLKAIDEHWVENCLVSGLGSGEALIEVLNNEDHRRLVIESEFARLLAIIAREGTTLSSIFRQCWDHGNADVTVRGKPLHCRNGHLSTIAHVTRDELLRRLSDTDIAGGFGNRFLWVCVRRSKELPFGGDSINIGDIPFRLREATDFARKTGNTRIHFDREARVLWQQVYHDLSEGKPGLFGAIIGRAEGQAVRLALIYALLDCAREIRIEHLRAALAVWNYCEASARYIWGDALGDPVADEVLRALRVSPDGCSRWDLSNLFSRHKPAEDLDRALAILVERGLIRFAREETSGRTVTRYWAL